MKLNESIGRFSVRKAVRFSIKKLYSRAECRTSCNHEFLHCVPTFFGFNPIQFLSRPGPYIVTTQSHDTTFLRRRAYYCTNSDCLSTGNFTHSGDGLGTGPADPLILLAKIDFLVIKKIFKNFYFQARQPPAAARSHPLARFSAVQSAHLFTLKTLCLYLNPIGHLLQPNRSFASTQ